MERTVKKSGEEGVPETVGGQRGALPRQAPSRKGGTCGAGLRRAGKGWKPGLRGLGSTQSLQEGLPWEPAPALLSEVPNPGWLQPA